MVKLTIIKSILLLFIVPGLLVGCQQVTDSAGENAHTNYTTAPQENASQNLASLNELTTVYNEFKPLLDQFIAQLQQVVDKKKDKNSVDGKSTLQKLEELRQANNSLRQKIQPSTAFVSDANNIDTTIQDIEKVIKPLKNGLETTAVTQVQQFLDLPNKSPIVKKNLGSFGEITQTEVQKYLINKSELLKTQIANLSNSIDNQLSENDTNIPEDQHQVPFQQILGVIVIIIVSYLTGAVMGAIAMFIYQQQRRGTSTQVRANNRQTGNPVTPSQRPVSSQSSTLRETSKISTENTQITPPVQEQEHTPTTYTQQPTTNNYSSSSDTVVASYNQNANSLSKSATEVSETEESINQRRLGSNQAAILEKVGRGKGNYWIIPGQGLDYLVPKGNIKINEYNYKTVEVLFDCQGYQTGYSSDFTLVEPAKVTRIDQERWQLLDHGVLRF